MKAAEKEVGSLDEKEILRSVISLLDTVASPYGGHEQPHFYRAICETAARLFSGAGSSLYVPDPSGESLIAVSIYDYYRNTMPGRRFGIGEGLAGAAYRSGEIEIHTTEKPHASYVSLSAKIDTIETLIAAPIKRPAQKPAGILCVVNPGAWTQDESAFLGGLDEFCRSLEPIFQWTELTQDMYDSNRRLQESVERTAHLYSIGVKVSDRRPAEEIFDEITSALASLFDFERVGLFLGDRTWMLLRSQRQFDVYLPAGDAIEIPEVPLSANTESVDRLEEAIALAIKRGSNTVCELSSRFFSHRAQLPQRTVGISLLESGEEFLGVVVFGRGWTNDVPITVADLDRAAIFLAQATLAIDQSGALSETEALYQNALRALADVLESRAGGQLLGHSEGLLSITMLIGERLSLSREEKRTLELGCVLHDIGKGRVPEELLLKAEPLTKQEFDQLREQIIMGSDLLDNVEGFSHVARLVRHHHERWDGTGYPDGLSGEAIPLGARIIAVAEAYDVMTRDKVYAEAKSHEAALAEIIDLAGRQFDPRIVDELIRIVEG